MIFALSEHPVTRFRASERLDQLLSERGLFPSRSRAAASVLAGEVLLLPERRRAEKPGQMVADDVELELRRDAGLRLPRGRQARHALDAFGST